MTCNAITVAANEILHLQKIHILPKSYLPTKKVLQSKKKTILLKQYTQSKLHNTFGNNQVAQKQVEKASWKGNLHKAINSKQFAQRFYKKANSKKYFAQSNMQKSYQQRVKFTCLVYF